MPAEIAIATRYSESARDFARRYEVESSLLQRYEMWTDVLSRYLTDVKTAYDMGCGTGQLAFFLAKAGVSVSGFDAAEGMIDVCRERKEALAVENVEFSQMTIPSRKCSLLPKGGPDRLLEHA